MKTLFRDNPDAAETILLANQRRSERGGQQERNNFPAATRSVVLERQVTAPTLAYQKREGIC
eukprot:3518743-Pleurochrysis_carterae.AAC.9